MASIHDVASKLPTGQPEPEHVWQRRHTLLDGLRFRANIYITGPPAFAEDDWKKAKLISSSNSSSSLNLHISCRTTRCKLPNVDPKTAVADRNEPLSTLRSYRVIDAGSKNACLGMQVTPLEEGAVAVGDVIEVLETGEHRFEGGEGAKVDG
ncbi:mosc domain-containing [Pyrenophora seminiperda CCB06]|uniref:Mosc domain-containing n=1 Tax=Pyrenophora seminiperda CCB06 TaxID=1302712 RepID=A0A3M7MGL8_9PLEO|nr:mosc domain-containing [Pyrenophora seminiperda CCB06]